MLYSRVAAVAATQLFLCASALFCQTGGLETQTKTMDQMGMGHMNMDHMDMSTGSHEAAGHAMDHMDMGEMNLSGSFLMNLSSGSAVNPAAWPMPMVMKPFGSWNAMFMAQGFLVETQQSGPRGGDKLYSPNWLMGNLEHSLGKKSAVQLQVMMSLDPATITQRRYPLLFQTGESAFGRPIVDAQHPHDLFMALNLQYARELNSHTVLQLSYGPVADPALGPVAYPHRASAMELPQATLAHHWQDSTHIANNVVTAGIAYRKFKLEASGFYGREPNENRWNIDFGPMNSWSTRLWFFPTRNWAAQVSVGRLANPEVTHPGDVVRSTASIQYSKPLPGGSWSSSLIWGRNHATDSGQNTNSYTAETVVPFHRRNFITGRAELVDKNELFSDDEDLEHSLAHTVGSTFRIGSYTAGYTRDIRLSSRVQTGIGANVEFYTLPDALKPYYGNHPVGGNIFIRVRLQAPE